MAVSEVIVHPGYPELHVTVKQHVVHGPSVPIMEFFAVYSLADHLQEWLTQQGIPIAWSCSPSPGRLGLDFRPGIRMPEHKALLYRLTFDVEKINHIG